MFLLTKKQIHLSFNQLNLISPTPQIAYQNLANLANEIKTIMQNNPNLNLGQIANLIP